MTPTFSPFARGRRHRADPRAHRGGRDAPRDDPGAVHDGAGFAVTIARDGRAALERLRGETFDVALLDIVMPGLDGLEVLRQTRDEPMPPEIIVITGNGTIETAIAALRLGAYDFLSKPYRMAEIEALVRRRGRSGSSRATTCCCSRGSGAHRPIRGS
jgi:DNA-binding response OmpR family regulator